MKPFSLYDKKRAQTWQLRLKMVHWWAAGRSEVAVKRGRECRRRAGEEEGCSETEDKSGMWLDGILGKVCSSFSHSLDLSWGQIPHGAERKPAGVCRATSTQECFTSNGKCSQLLLKLSLSLFLHFYLSICLLPLTESVCVSDNSYF